MPQKSKQLRIMPFVESPLPSTFPRSLLLRLCGFGDLVQDKTRSAVMRLHRKSDHQSPIERD